MLLFVQDKGKNITIICEQIKLYYLYNDTDIKKVSDFFEKLLDDTNIKLVY